MTLPVPLGETAALSLGLAAFGLFAAIDPFLGIVPIAIAALTFKATN